MGKAVIQKRVNTVRHDEPNDSLIHYEISRLRDRLSLTSGLGSNNINAHKKCAAFRAAIDHLESATARTTREDIA